MNDGVKAAGAAATGAAVGAGTYATIGGIGIAAGGTAVGDGLSGADPGAPTASVFLLRRSGSGGSRGHLRRSSRRPPDGRSRCGLPPGG